MEYKLEDIIDVPLLQNLQEKLNLVYSFPSAVIDINGKILTAVAWQDICTKFHRKHPECEKECIKSDNYIYDHMHEADPAVSYTCPHGLVDNATPIIIEGNHLGNFFTGQFFLEKPDLEFFTIQAHKYGFDENDYLEAVNKVPVWTKEKLTLYLDFIKGFIEIIAGMGYRNLQEMKITKVIRESEEKFKFYTENSPLAVIEWDFDYTIIQWTGEAERIFGWKKEEVTGKKLNEIQIIYEPDNAIVQDVIKKLSFGEELQVISKNRNFRKDKTVIHCEWYNTVLKDEHGSMESVFSQVLDVTHRVHSAEILMRSEEKYRMLFKNMITGFALHEIILDNEGKPYDYRFLEINPAFEFLTGLNAADLIGKTCRQVLPDIEEFWYEKYGVVALSGKSITFENFSISLNKYYQVSAYSPEKYKFATLFIDITERKNAELEIEKMTQSLKSLNNRIVEVSENERALLARELHDQLGQSLTALKLETQWIYKRTEENSTVNEKLGQMVSLIDSTIKDVQRISTELRPAILDNVSLTAAMEWYCREFEKRTAINCNLKLENIQSPDDNRNLALYRILQESLTNVIRHARAENIEVCLNKQNDSIVLEITDDGIGIGQEKIDSHNSLGLIGMMERVSQHEGSMNILSGAGGGTTLKFNIPLT